MKTIEERTEELRQVIEQAKASVQTVPCDFESKAEVKAFEKHIEAVFKSRINLIKSYENSGADAEPFTYDCLQRRTAAILSVAQKTAERYRVLYPQLSPAHTLAQLCAPCPSGTFSELDRLYHVETAAAIWILDRLKSGGRLDEALEFLPESREELDRVDMPNVTDTVHSDDLIRGMLYVIRYRNSGMKGFDEEKAFMDDADAGLQADAAGEPLIGRVRFDAVTELIDKDSVSTAEDEFLRQTGQLTDDLFAVTSRLQSRRIALTEQKIKMIQDEIRRVTQAAGESTAFETTCTVTDDPSLSPVQVEEELQKTDDQLQTFFMSVLLLTPERQDEIRELLGEELFSLIRLPDVSDPFSLCFAFLRLLDRGCDEIWLYNPPYLILRNACRELPWAGIAAENAVFTDELVEAAKNHPEQYITPPDDSILKRVRVKPPFVDPTRKDIRFSQLVYMMSGLVPPRGLPEMSYMKSLFTDSGLQPGEVEALYEYLSLAYLTAQRDENYVFIDEEGKIEGSEADAPEEDDTAQELRELKRENKNLKAMINKLEHRLRESGEALKNADESLNEASAELAELRSMIRRAEKEQEDYTATVSFPYAVQKRTVVFGGHSSWAKAIKPLLPDVRFIEPSAQPNTGLILNADVVWIQTNAMSHSNFYKIIDIVRKHDIELHYFKYASAEKCAEQLALNDSDEA